LSQIQLYIAMTAHMISCNGLLALCAPVRRRPNFRTDFMVIGEIGLTTDCWVRSYN